MKSVYNPSLINKVSALGYSTEILGLIDSLPVLREFAHKVWPPDQDGASLASLNLERLLHAEDPIDYLEEQLHV